MQENLILFNFELDAEDMQAIAALDTAHSLFLDHHSGETTKQFMEWRAVVKPTEQKKGIHKYLFGRKRKYGDFDSFEFMPADAAKLHRMVSCLRAWQDDKSKHQREINNMMYSFSPRQIFDSCRGEKQHLKQTSNKKHEDAYLRLKPVICKH